MVIVSSSLLRWNPSDLVYHPKFDLGIGEEWLPLFRVARPLFSHRGIIASSISTPCEKGSGALPLTYLCQPPSGILSVNCLLINHRCLYIFSIGHVMHTTTTLASKEAVIEDIINHYNNKERN